MNYKISFCLTALAFSAVRAGVVINARQDTNATTTATPTPTTVLPSCSSTPTSELNFEGFTIPTTTTSVPLPTVYNGLKITASSLAVVDVNLTSTDPFANAQRIRAFQQTKPNILYIPSGSVSFEPEDPTCYFGTWTYRWAYPNTPMNLTITTEYAWANSAHYWTLIFNEPGNTGTLNWRQPASTYFTTKLTLEARDLEGKLIPFYMDDIWPGFRCGCDGLPHVTYN